MHVFCMCTHVCMHAYLYMQIHTHTYVRTHTDRLAAHEPAHTPSFPHQTKHCNLSPSLSHSDLRPLKVSSWFVAGRNVRAVDSNSGQRGCYSMWWQIAMLYVLCVCLRGCCFFRQCVCVYIEVKEA